MGIVLPTDERPRPSVGFDEMAAAILLPAALVVLHAEGLLLAETDGVELARGDAEGNKILLHGGGAAVAETEIVFGRAAFVAVALDGRFNRGMRFEELSRLSERGTGVGADVRFVKIEESILHFPRP